MNYSKLWSLYMVLYLRLELTVLSLRIELEATVFAIRYRRVAHL